MVSDWGRPSVLIFYRLQISVIKIEVGVSGFLVWII